MGRDSVDKRIDTITVAMHLGAGIEALKELEPVYAPPCSSAKDPVNMAGLVAENVRAGLVSFADWGEAERNPATVVLDVREGAELMAYATPGARHILLGQLRSRLEELDQEVEIIIFCAIGVRAYDGARILMQRGFQHMKVYPGGMRFYQSTHYKNHVTPMLMAASVNDDLRAVSAPDARTAGTMPGGIRAVSAPNRTGAVPTQDSAGMASTSSISDILKTAIRLDCSDLQCPGPIMKMLETMKEIGGDGVVEVSASGPGFARDIDTWCRRTGSVLVSSERRGNDYVACVGKCTSVLQTVVKDTPRGKAIIVFSGDLDKVLAGFIIANGAAVTERPVTMFLTFWDLTALRKEEERPAKKTFMESTFGAMLPRGSKKLKLFKMNMTGMGTTVVEKIMSDKSVGSLETLIQKAMASSAKIFAHTISMDMMGIKGEKLIDGVELGGVDAYLGDAEESNMNLSAQADISDICIYELTYWNWQVSK